MVSLLIGRRPRGRQAKDLLLVAVIILAAVPVVAHARVDDGSGKQGAGIQRDQFRRRDDRDDRAEEVAGEQGA